MNPKTSDNGPFDKSLLNYLEMFRGIIDFFPDYIFIKDLSFRYQLANRLWIELSGTTEDQYRGKSDYDLFPKEIADNYIQSDKEAIRSGKISGNIAEQVTDDGKRITISFSKGLLKGPDGEACGILGIFRDISLEYEEKERFLRLKDASIQSSIEGVSFYNSQGYLLDANPAFHSICQGIDLDYDEIDLSEIVYRLFGNDMRDGVEGFLDSDSIGSVLKDCRSVIDGRVLSPFISKVIGRSDKWIGLMFVLRDVTDLRQSEERYRNLVQDANSIIIQIDRDGTILFANNFAETILGYPHNGLRGLNGAGIIYQSTDWINKVFSDPAGVRYYENECVKKDGGKIWVSWTYRVYHDAQGNPHELLCVGIDISGRKEIEKAFVRAQKMEAIGVLINGLAHDLNNLLSGINGYLSTIELQNENHMDPVIAESLTKSRQLIVSSSNLIHEILPLGRKGSKERETVNLNEMLEDVLELVMKTRGKKVAVEKKLDSGIPLFHCQKVEIQQIILNIMLNAFDSMDSSGTITLTTESMPRSRYGKTGTVNAGNDRYFAIGIGDTGTGMSEEVLSHIFEPYFTTKEQKKGTGLGLAVAYSLVVNHGGHIHVESTPGAGTKFWIYFPY